MKQLLVITCAIFFAGCTMAQRGPLRGSGKVVNRVFNYTGFDKISLHNLDGKISVTSGSAFSISIDIDDNLESLLTVKNSDGVLHVSLAGNKNNRLYIEDTHIAVTITLPEISVLEHFGNSSLTVNGITGRYFRLQNGDNGSAALYGTIDELEIKNTGNGNVNAEALVAQQATVRARGNGNVWVNAEKKLEASASGNCSIISKGKAVFSGGSSATGNAQLKPAGM
jgi:hypothetical protein